MSIVATTVTILAGNEVVERHTDHTGGIHQMSWIAPSDWTQQQIEDRAALRAVALLPLLADAEADWILAE